MKKRREPDVIPCCERCGEPTEDGRERRSIAGERLCRGCADEEEEDIAAADGDYVVGIGREASSPPRSDDR